MAQADEQAQAIANLVGLGANVAPALAVTAAPQPFLLAAQALLAVARALAPSTSAVLPTLVELMCHMPVDAGEALVDVATPDAFDDARGGWVRGCSVR